MSDWQQIDVDRTGTGLFVSQDDNGNQIYKTVENCQPLLDFTQEKRNNESGNHKRDIYHKASIPASLWLEWWNEFGGNPMAPENQPRLRKKLNNPDYAKLLTKTGRL